MGQRLHSAESTPTNWAARCLLALALATGVPLPIGNGQSVVSPKFGGYLVSSVYQGVVRPPDVGDLDQYRGTDLRCFGGDRAVSAKEHVNFAGHFVIDACTCGTGCHYLYMWDALTGKFYQRLPPGAIDVGPYARRGVQPSGIVYKGEQYQPNSNLLIVDGCIADTCDCAMRYYKWTGSQFTLILRQPVRMPERCLKKQ